MQLSYINRLLCLALCGAGMLQVALESMARRIAPRLLHAHPGASARRTERSLFLLTLFARLTPWLVVLGAWLPAYMRGEDNLSAEHVGIAPVLAASCVCACWLAACVRLSHAWFLTRRYCGQCTPAGSSGEGLPVLLHPGPHPFLAVAGIFRSRIIVSQSLLASPRFSPASLEIAFLHESAHAKHHDNLKRLILALLPHIPLATRSRPSLQQHWLLAAEMAADEAGARGKPQRSILLAELLVAMAKESIHPAPHATLALLSRAEDLRTRIDRLLPPASQSLPAAQARLARLQAPAAFAFACAVLAALCYLGLAGGHRLSELLLHLG